MAFPYNSQLDAFELYHRAQEGNKSKNSAPSTTALRAIAGGLSGSAGAAISNVATYPLDLIITRLQLQRQLRKDASKASAEEYTGFQDAAEKILNKEGWTGMYTGLLSDTGKTLMDSFLFFLTYEFIRNRRLRRGGENRKMLPALEELSVGFLAGSLTKLCTSPIANVVTRQQAASFTSSKDKSVRAIIDDILEEKGPMGFWSGYSASLVLTLNPSLTFFLFETLKRVFLPSSQREQPPAAATFFLAAISKACASSVTYPFSLAKARLQAGNMKRESHDETKVVDEKIPGGDKAKKAARSTIFSTILAIAQNEGVSALYEGLHLEIVKAFFSHGITMLVKQAIQRLMVKAYYILSILYSSVTGQANIRRLRLAEKAKASGYEYYDLAIKRSSEKMEDVQKLAEVASEKAKQAAGFVAEYIDEDGGGQE